MEIHIFPSFLDLRQPSAANHAPSTIYSCYFHMIFTSLTQFIGTHLSEKGIFLSSFRYFLRNLHLNLDIRPNEKGNHKTKKIKTMKKVFLTAALVLACTAGSLANELNETSLSEMVSCPVKKTTKKTTTKKTTTKKSTTAKTSTNAAKSTTTTSTPSTASTATTTTPSTANSATSTQSSTGSTIAGILGAVLGGSSSSSSSSTGSAAGSILNGILNNVIGSGTFKQADLCASTWKYNKPGCAFTSENLLAKAGGEIAANKIESELSTYYNKAGFTSSNTYFKFNEDGTFESKIKGKTWKGTYTFDESTHAITMKGLLLSVSGFATRQTNGISILFESKKLLTLVQTLTALSGNSTLSTIGNITKNYDGVRVGFEMTK